MEPLDAVKMIGVAPTTVISKVVLIESVVRTRLDSILEKVNTLAGDRVVSDDSFKVICDLRGRKYIESKEELVERIKNELTEKFDLKSSDRGILIGLYKSKWWEKIQVSVYSTLK